MIRDRAKMLHMNCMQVDIRYRKAQVPFFYHVILA